MSALDAVLRTVAIMLGVTGGFFFFVGTVGMLRLPDFYSRTHAATKCDTVGAGSILLGLALLQGLDIASLKLLALAALILLTSPTAGHALARAAYRTGLPVWRLPEPAGSTAAVTTAASAATARENAPEPGYPGGGDLA